MTLRGYALIHLLIRGKVVYSTSSNQRNENVNVVFGISLIVNEQSLPAYDGEKDPSPAFSFAPPP